MPRIIASKDRALHQRPQDSDEGLCVPLTSAGYDIATRLVPLSVSTTSLGAGFPFWILPLPKD